MIMSNTWNKEMKMIVMKTCGNTTLSCRTLALASGRGGRRHDMANGSIMEQRMWKRDIKSCQCIHKCGDDDSRRSTSQTLCLSSRNKYPSPLQTVTHSSIRSSLLLRREPSLRWSQMTIRARAQADAIPIRGYDCKLSLSCETSTTREDNLYAKRWKRGNQSIIRAYTTNADDVGHNGELDSELDHRWTSAENDWLSRNMNRAASEFLSDGYDFEDDHKDGDDADSDGIYHPSTEIAAYRAAENLASHENQNEPPTCAADLIEGWHVDDLNVEISHETKAKSGPGSGSDLIRRMKESGELEALSMQLEEDAMKLMKYIGRYGSDLPKYCNGAKDIAEWELSIVLVDDNYIRELNKQWRQQDKATDVLSFGQLPDPAIRSAINIWLLGDVIISLDTASRQAEDRSHSLLDEMRILLLHGVLHLIGYDHEYSPEAGIMMGERELECMDVLQWKGKGLIESAGSFDAHKSYSADISTGNITNDPNVSACKEESSLEEEQEGKEERIQRGHEHVVGRPQKKLIALDLDGTLLRSDQSIDSDTISVLKEAMSRGVRVIAATGKARPAAIEVLSRAGLAMPPGIQSDACNEYMIGSGKPGIFLQGLAVYDMHGKLLPGRKLDTSLVIDAFLYSIENDVPLVGFCGDTTITMRDHSLIQELHEKYSEPKARVLSSGLDELLTIPAVYKLLFLDASPEYVGRTLRPIWEEKLVGKDAEVVQAIDYMLEIVPSGVNKGQALSRLLDEMNSLTMTGNDRSYGDLITLDDVLAVGDGENDIVMLDSVGIGVAMGNATDKVLSIADYTVGDNDHGGVAEAIRKFVL